MVKRYFTMGLLLATLTFSGFSQSVEQLFNQGLDRHNRADYTGAISNFSIAISLKPDYATLYFCRGKSYAELKEYEKAIDDFSKSIEINPLHTKAYIEIANAFREVNMSSDAIKNLDKLLVTEPSNIEALMLRGLAKIDKSDFMGSIS